MDHALTQFAGEVGLISVGLGKDLGRWSISGMYGVVPSELAGGPFIETVTLRLAYQLGNWKRFSFHLGLNIYHVIGLSYEATEYGEPPKSYYSIGSVRGLLYLGTSYQLDKKERNFIYFEGGLNDIWIVNSLVNKSAINPFEHVSLALGLKHQF